MNQQSQKWALTGLLVAIIFVSAFVGVVPDWLRPYAGALLTALGGMATLFHVVPPSLQPAPAQK